MHRLVDGVTAVRDGVDPQDAVRHHRDVELHEVPVGPLGLGHAREHLALEHDLRARRHLHVHGHALRQLQGLAPEGAGQPQLVVAEGEGGGPRHQLRRVVADGDGHGQPLAARPGSVVELAQVLGRHHPDADLVGPAEHHPVEGHVADPRLRVLGDDQARRHVRRGVLLRVDDEGEAAEVDVGARPHDLLDGRVAHDHRRDPPAAPLEKRRDQRLGRDAEPQGEEPAAPDHVGHDRHRRAHDGLEEDGPAAALGFRDQRGQLGPRVDRAADAEEPLVSLEASQAGAEVGLHRAGVYCRRCASASGSSSISARRAS